MYGIVLVEEDEFIVKMGFVFKLFIIGSAFSAVYLASFLHRNTPIPRLNEEWWAEGKPAIKDESIKPFKIDVPDEVNQAFI